eukprot:scaffold139045_cov28-Prasinocladus_malaysianus.AAC.1
MQNEAKVTAKLCFIHPAENEDRVSFGTVDRAGNVPPPRCDQLSSLGCLAERAPKLMHTSM